MLVVIGFLVWGRWRGRSAAGWWRRGVGGMVGYSEEFCGGEYFEDRRRLKRGRLVFCVSGGRKGEGRKDVECSRAG